METALLYKARRRLLSVGRAVGRYASNLAALHGRAEHRLVDEILSSRQRAASDRRSLRRLSLGKLQHPDQECDRVERGLRKMPWSGQHSRPKSVEGEHRGSGTPGLFPGVQRLYSVPFAGATAGESGQRQIL